MNSIRNTLYKLEARGNSSQHFGLLGAITLTSKNGVPIRLTDERWLHITEEHSEMAGYYFVKKTDL
ncbi:MAG: hypothetical protein ACXQTW_02655 [Candidatus Methanospirareceae archaeon]